MTGQGKPRRRDLRMEAYHWLRTRIVSAELVPGTSFTERQIAEQLGTSTVPVREALLLLAGHHLVSARNGAGYSVAPITAQGADSTLRLQVQLDGEAAAAAANVGQRDTGPHLLTILSEVGPKADHTWDDPGCNSHFDFHHHIALHADHAALAKAVHDCLLETERIRRHLLRQGADVSHDVSEHHALVDAVTMGRAAAAGKIAREHARAHRSQLVLALKG